MARTSATILATATVVTDRVGFASMQPVASKASRSATSATVPPTAAAGHWRFVGPASTQIGLKFTLPAELMNLQSPGAAISIVFSRTAGLLAPGVDDPTRAVAFDPGEGTVGRFGTGPTPTLYLWLGSTVVTSPSTTAGIYHGTVTLTVVYY
jgi:hypothetical protein